MFPRPPIGNAAAAQDYVGGFLAFRARTIYLTALESLDEEAHPLPPGELARYVQ